MSSELFESQNAFLAHFSGGSEATQANSTWPGRVGLLSIIVILFGRIRSQTISVA